MPTEKHDPSCPAPHAECSCPSTFEADHHTPDCPIWEGGEPGGLFGNFAPEYGSERLVLEAGTARAFLRPPTAVHGEHFAGHYQLTIYRDLDGESHDQVDLYARNPLELIEILDATLKIWGASE